MKEMRLREVIIKYNPDPFKVLDLTLLIILIYTPCYMSNVAGTS